MAAVSLEPSLLPMALSAPSNYPLPSPGRGKLRYHNWELLLKGRGRGNPDQLEQGGTLAG